MFSNKQIFSVPTFDDIISLHTGQLLLIILNIAIVAATAFVIVGLTITPFANTLQTLTVAVALLVFVCLKLLVHRGYVQAVSWLLVILLSITVTLASALDDGIFDSAFTGYILVVIVSSLLLGTTVSVGVALLGMATGLCMIHALVSFSSGDAEVVNDATELLVTYMLFFSTSVTLLHHITRNVTTAFQRAYESEQKQTAQYQMLRGVIDALPDQIFVKDLNGRITLANTTYLNEHGLTLNEAVGKTVGDIYPEQDAKAYANADQQVMNTGKPFVTMEHYLVDASTEERRWQLVTKVPLYVAGGEMIGLVGHIHNVTERLQLEDHIRYQAELLQQVNDAIISTDNSGFIQSWNRAAEVTYGIPAQVAIGKYISDVLPTNYPSTTREEAIRHVRENDHWHGIVEQYLPDGRSLTIESSVSTVHDAGTNVTGLVAINRNITEQTQAERALRDSQERLKLFLDASTEYISIFDSKLNLVEVNASLLDLYHKTRDEVIGRNLLEILPGIAETGRIDLYRQVIATGNSLTLEEIVPFGISDDRIHSVRAFKVGDGLGLIASDITDRKRAEQALRESEERLKLFLDAATDAISILDADLNYVEINASALELSGRVRENVINTNLLELLPELAETGRIEAYRNVIATGEPLILPEVRMPLPRVSDAVFTIRAYKVGDGLGIVGTDITEQKQAEQAIKESQSRLKLFLDASTDYIIIMDANFNILDVNQAGLDLYGVTLDDVVGLPFENFLPYFPHSDRFDLYRQVIATGEPLIIEEVNPPSPDVLAGRTLAVRAFKVGEGIGLVVSDITERKQAEGQRREAERLQIELEAHRELLETKNRYMSVISHEFRTPLTVINTTADILERYWAQIEVSERQAQLRRICSQVARLDQLLSDFALAIRAETGHVEFEPELINLNIFCRDIVDDFRNLSSNRYDFVLKEENDGEMIEADERLLGYIIRNLLSNAVKYSPRGGQIVLRLVQQGADVTIEITDEGIGIPLEDQYRLFEPYFRASNVTHIHGTGLGLKIVRDFVELHRGRIIVTSREDEGTTFSIYLPAESKSAVDEYPDPHR